MMVQVLSVVCGIPAAVAGVCFWVVPARKIKTAWALGGVIYVLGYLAVFHLWLKAI
jgi:hypothetical protein